MPTDNRPNGLRVDIAQAMADLQPSTFRFPGGNNLEGQTVGESIFPDLYLSDWIVRLTFVTHRHTLAVGPNHRASRQSSWAQGRLGL